MRSGALVCGEGQHGAWGKGHRVRGEGRGAWSMVLAAWGVGHGVQPKILAIPTSKKPPPHLSAYTSHLPSDITLQQISHPLQR